MAHSSLAEIADILEERWELSRQGSSQAAGRLMELDAEVRRRFERTVAPFVLDIAGFTRLTAQLGIVHYLSLIHRLRKQCLPLVERHGGTVVKFEADNLFAHFPTADDALAAALHIQKSFDRDNVDLPEEFDIHISVGIGFGPLLVFADDMWGQEFNLASKLGEDVADSREVMLTAAARDALSDDAPSFVEVPVAVSGLPFTAHRLVEPH